MALLNEEDFSFAPRTSSSTISRPKLALIIGDSTSYSAAQTRKTRFWTPTAVRVGKAGRELGESVSHYFPTPFSPSIGHFFPTPFSPCAESVPDDGVYADMENPSLGYIDELPPIDGGRRAWLFLLGAFGVEGVMWGTALILKASP